MKSEEIKKIAKIFDRIATLMEDLQNNIKYHQSEYDELMNKKLDPDYEMSMWEKQDMENQTITIEAYESIIEYLSKYKPWLR